MHINQLPAALAEYLLRREELPAVLALRLSSSKIEEIRKHEADFVTWNGLAVEMTHKTRKERRTSLLSKLATAKSSAEFMEVSAELIRHDSTTDDVFDVLKRRCRGALAHIAICILPELQSERARLTEYLPAVESIDLAPLGLSAASLVNQVRAQIDIVDNSIEMVNRTIRTDSGGASAPHHLLSMFVDDTGDLRTRELDSSS